MKITSISFKRNYHISNDDNYAKAEFGANADLDETDDKTDCYLKLGAITDAAFQAKFPNVRTYLNFDEVIQVEKSNYSDINYKGLPMDVAPRSPFIRKDAPEKINKGTIEEPYDIIKEINSCKSLTVLSIYEKQCKTDEQKKAYQKKYKEFESETIKKYPPQKSNSIKQ